MLIENSWTSCGWDAFKGTLKKSRLNYKAPTSANCTDLIGNLNFFHSENGVVKATGSWKTANRYSQGTYKCEQ